MKNLIILCTALCISLSGAFAQNQSKEKSNERVIVKKITIQNVDGKETRVETIDTFDSATWKDESLKDDEIEVIVKDADDIHLFPGSGEHMQLMNPEHFKMQWNQAAEEEHEMVTPPNKAVLGVQLNNVDGENGAQISEVFEGSAAEKAGLEEGDILLSVDGKETKTVEDVIASLSDNKPGDKVKITYLRGTKVKNLRATLQERKEQKISMKSCSPSCMTMMKRCTPEDMEKSMKNKMFLDDKMREELKKEMEGMKGVEGKKKVIIINKKDGDVKILRSHGMGSNDAEAVKQQARDEQIKSEIARTTEKQSLNVEYLTTSPNPNNGQMKIRFAGMAVPTTIQVLDLNGKELYNEKLNEFDGVYNKDIDIKNEARGTLILKIIQGDKVMTQKIIVE
jgi:hypothetical protein